MKVVIFQETSECCNGNTTSLNLRMVLPVLVTLNAITPPMPGLMLRRQLSELLEK
jgi:hypothetical protein